MANDSSDDRKHSSESFEESEDTDEGSLDALMRDYDDLSSTPPRTRIHRRQIKKNIISGGKISIGTKKTIKSPTEHNQESDEVSDQHVTRRKTSKRETQLLRHFERNIKLVDIIDGNPVPNEAKNDDKCPFPCNMKVESSKRFLSLSCTLIKPASNWKRSLPETAKSRTEFHHFFEKLVKTGNLENNDKIYKSQLSDEEHMWQTEWKDMIWLELQAWIADRTVTEQDKYLCEARKEIPNLLDDILNYRFERKSDKLSSQSSDSGIFAYDLDDPPLACSGCLCMFCPSCIEQADIALKEVGELLSKLEAAESLFPSSKAFGNYFPLYKSNAFIGRVKAMCLWYNITIHHRLKLIILGKQLLSFAQRTDCNYSPALNYNDEWNFRKLSSDEPFHCLGKFFHKMDNGDTKTYRRFVEEVLKVKGLRKSLLFLDYVYLKVLKKTSIALEKPDYSTLNSDDYNVSELKKYGYWSNEYKSLNLPSFRQAFIFISRIPLDVIHEFLRMRLETKLEKPSILSIRQLIKELKEGLKLSVINKQRYSNHYIIAITAAKNDNENEEEARSKLLEYLEPFDESLQAVLKLYLNYLEQWCSSTSEWSKIHKNLMEEEWKFVVYIAPNIPNGEGIICKVFCDIISSVMANICDYIETQADSLLKGEHHNLHSTHEKLQLCRGFQSLFMCIRQRVINMIISMKTVVKHIESSNEAECERLTESLEKMREKALELFHILKKNLEVVEDLLFKTFSNDLENLVLNTACRGVLHQIYKCIFEYYKELWKIIMNKRELARAMFTFCKKWFHFVKTYCERGRGVRPRWASYGIEFLVCISSPKYMIHLSDDEFEIFKNEMKACFHYINGDPVSNNLTPILSKRSVPASPAAFPRNNYTTNVTDISLNSLGFQDEKLSGHFVEKCKSQQDRVLAAVVALNDKIEQKLRSQELIGNVITSHTNYDRNFIKPKAVTFTWQRGTKIGQGRFGKVYTAVNNQTGELLAMKEIPLSPNDVRTIKSVALEMKIFEGIKHENLVRYYGAEIHREELLIFMELCPEGTLDSLVLGTENGLPESIVRRYSSQLVNAIAKLHENSIVHRDIKPANIFLTSEGNRLKLGDFGSAVKIRAHTTAPGELKGFVGTQAYMAPEVFMKSNSVGHGRAVDIWSLGCVIIEMASGKRPWAEYDSNYQIMFKVGMGETPAIPESISEEGKRFISSCMKHNHKKRATIIQLKQDNFLKVESEDEGFFFNMPSVLEDYLKLGIKR